jgi:hypothetical protein
MLAEREGGPLTPERPEGSIKCAAAWQTVYRGPDWRTEMLNGLQRLILALAVAGAASLAWGQTVPYKAPRTADGQPDLQGIWTNASLTPLERPPELAGKEFFTAAEAAAYSKDLLKQVSSERRDGGADADLARAYNDFWWDRGSSVSKTMRTSLITDPKNGRLPPYTPEAQKRMAADAEYARLHPADGPEDLRLSDRCLLWRTAGPPMMPANYNNMYQIFQTPGYVAILVEMIHDVRIIPLDGRPHLPPNVREWMGDSRGHWEGNTLVVDTTNFTNKTKFLGTTENMHLIERFTRTDPDTILYEFTVEDPATFTRPWTAQLTMSKDKGPIFEYACHEGNIAMRDILAGARAQEKAEAEKAAGK